MKKWIKRHVLGNVEDELEIMRDRADRIRANIESMREAFAHGGSITWEQLGSYEISTAEAPKPYPTGANCMTYRLPDVEDQRVFRTICVAPEGEVGSFGWHFHPKSSERNIQLTHTAIHNGVEVPPYGTTEFAPGIAHDYILPPGGEVLTYFKKIHS